MITLLCHILYSRQSIALYSSAIDIHVDTVYSCTIIIHGEALFDVVEKTSVVYCSCQQ